MRAGKTDTEAGCEGREAFTTRTSESAVPRRRGTSHKTVLFILDRPDDVTHGRVNSEQQKRIYCETQRQHAETDGYHLVTEWRQQQGPETKKD